VTVARVMCTAVNTMNGRASAPTGGALVSIGLPVRNGAATLEGVVKSVLAQDYEPLELIISDNASTDDTEDLCRELASADSRIIYHRQSSNVGLLNNFIHALRLARGAFFRWVGDDDWLAPTYISQCVEVFADDGRLVLVTTQLNYVEADGNTYTLECPDTTMRSDDPIERFERLASYLAGGYLPLDPLYALARRDSLLSIARRNVIREDEVFAAKLALAGPWGHVPEILGSRNLRSQRLPVAARSLGVPVWQGYVPTAVQCWEMLRFLRTADITSSQRRRATVAVSRVFVGRQWRTLAWQIRKFGGLVAIWSREGGRG